MRHAIYVGELHKSRKLEILLEAWSLIKVEDAKLFIVGGGRDFYRIQSLSIEFDNVFVSGSYPHSKLMEVLPRMDVGISLIPPTKYYMYSSPIKVLEYMACGVPVLANFEIPAHEYIITASRCGWLTMYNPYMIAGVLSMALKTRNAKETMGANGRKWVMENRNYDAMVAGLSEVIRGLKR